MRLPRILVLVLTFSTLAFLRPSKNGSTWRWSASNASTPASAALPPLPPTLPPSLPALLDPMEASLRDACESSFRDDLSPLFLLP